MNDDKAMMAQWETVGRVVQPSGQRMDGVEQSKRGGVFVCDMEGPTYAKTVEGDGGQQWVAERWRECPRKGLWGR